MLEFEQNQSKENQPPENQPIENQPIENQVTENRQDPMIGRLPSDLNGEYHKKFTKMKVF